MVDARNDEVRVTLVAVWWPFCGVSEVDSKTNHKRNSIKGKVLPVDK
jgi:hypothetical protein